MHHSEREQAQTASRLLILWSSGDREVALTMVLIYARNAQRNHWWDELRFVVWGPSAKLLTEDQELQEQVRALITAGVNVQACKWCTDQYDVAQSLELLGVEVLSMGIPLSTMLQSGWTSLTF